MPAGAQPCTHDLRTASVATRPARLQLEGERDGAVVDELDAHPGAEDAGLDGDPLRPQRLAERLVERLRLLRRRCLREARTVALARVCEQRELTDDERRAADVQEREVEAPVGLEDPQPRDLPREPRRRLLPVASRHAEQDEQAATDGADDAPVR